MGGIERLENSIVEGPPQSAFEEWASDAGSSWIPWAGVVAATAGLLSLVALIRRREVVDRPNQPPTTNRPPGNLPPALAGALVAGGPQASAVPATILDLARRDALDIEPESEGGTFSKPKVRIRLVDRNQVQNSIEATMWSELERRAEEGVISSEGLEKVAGDSASVRRSVEQDLLAEGWLDPRASSKRAPFIVVAILSALLAFGSFVIALVGATWLPVIGLVALAGVTVAAMVMYSRFPTLTPAGQEAAMPWRAYRAGLERAAKDRTAALDLDAVLADAVAMNLGARMEDRLKRANASGEALRAFTSHTGVDYSAQYAATFPWWIAFSSTVATSSGSATATVSGAGAGGGGGAAGST
ncbi:MAG: DUF2207 domain-containing protein [Thermomicrobiales bacterium]